MGLIYAILILFASFIQMAENVSEYPEERVKKASSSFDFGIDLSHFSRNITSNFQLMFRTIEEHAAEIDLLKKKLLSLETVHKFEEQRGSERQMSLNLSDFSYKQSGFDKFQSNPEENRSIEPPVAYLSQKQVLIGSSPSAASIHIEDPEVKKEIIKVISPKQIEQIQQQQEVQQKKEVQQQKVQQQKVQQKKEDEHTSSISLIERKVFEINERLEKLELQSVKEVGAVSRKFNQFQNQIEDSKEMVAKRDGEFKRLEGVIEMLRTELAGYKLKKEAQLMKMAKSSDGKSTSPEMNEYILQKLHEISLNMEDYATRIELQTVEQQLLAQVQKIKKRASSSVTLEQVDSMLKVLSKNKASSFNVSSVARSRNKPLAAGTEPEPEGDDELEFLLKVQEMEKAVQGLQQSLIEQKSSRADNYSALAQKVKQISKSNTELKNLAQKTESKVGDHQSFLKQMNLTYNEKIKEIEGQIIDTQQSYEKLNSQMKFYSYTAKSDASMPSTMINSSAGSLATDQGRLIGIETEIATLKKKNNKLILKIQGSKEETLAFRQDFARELEGVRMQLQKKSDWESLKKAMHFFEEKLKDLSNALLSVQSQMEVDEKGESTAAKKGWTCLCCDKDIKQFEGKMSEVKFTSVFPARYQSPRIGGYFKSRQADKQYKQIFMSKPQAHQRRLSQNPPNGNGATNQSQSKEV